MVCSLAALVAFGGLSLVPTCGRVLVQWSFLHTNLLNFELPIILDYIRISFFFSVSLISSQVYLFSFSYMSSEKFSVRFHLLVLRFITSMYVLILVPHLVIVLIGWDGLGVTSYLLVIYFQSTKSFNAGLLTALRNRAGDCAILLRIAVLARGGGWSFGLQGMLISQNSAWAALIIFAACTKSAQIPFSAWLPAAMAAPTPVSALVHSSTLVTAGVYLLIRFRVFLSFRGSSTIFYFLGRLTILMAGLAALTECDIKKIVALSTLRQLGVIITTAGAGWPQVAFFHLLLHAYFKALLFMAVGFMIHNARDYQDLRVVGLSSNQFPLIISIFLVSNLRLCGAPFIRGFFSKDMCIEAIMGTQGGLALILVFYLATALTVVYTVRVVILTYLSSCNKQSFDWGLDGDTQTLWSCLALFILSCTAGSWFGLSLVSAPASIFLSWEIKNCTLAVIALGAVVGARAGKVGVKTNLVLLRNMLAIWSLPQLSSQPRRLAGLTIAVTQRSLAELCWTEMVVIDLPTTVYRGAWLPPHRNKDTFYATGAGIVGLLLMLSLWYKCVNFLTPKRSKLFMRLHLH